MYDLKSQGALQSTPHSLLKWSLCPSIPLLKHLRRHGCILKREGASHSLWANPRTGHVQTVPRHTEMPKLLAKKICRGLFLPEP
jgi:mRNA interferase HicA